MPYFSPSVASQSFSTIASRLAEEIAAAEPHLRAIDDRQAAPPRAAGKWSRKEILGHLIDSAANNHQRFVRGQAADELHDPGYAQRQWVASQGYASRDWTDLVDLWCAYNRHLVHVIAAVPESRRDTLVRIAADPPVSLSFVALDYVGHIQHHPAQIFDRTPA
jgi:hypothetical protein